MSSPRLTPESAPAAGSRSAADLSEDEVAAAAALRADLLEVGYTVDGLDQLLGADGSADLQRDRFAALRWRLDRMQHQTAEPAPEPRHSEPRPAEAQTAEAARRLTALLRLFLLGDAVPLPDVAAAVPRCGVAGLRRLGLVTTDQTAADHAPGEQSVRALLDLRPYSEADGPPWWLVSDLGEAVSGRTLTPDYVLGVGLASLTLAAATPRPAVARALDLGTGCGVQALHLTRHCEQVVATDVSARALQLTRLGLAISDLSVDTRLGDLFAPVSDERFDLIVSNPPFVITPRLDDVPTFTYRDGGRAGDELVRQLLDAAPARLNPGGLFVALANWEVPAEEDWTARPTTWLDALTDPDGVPIDAWVIQRELLEPAEYAALWVRDGGSEPMQHEARVHAWLDDFAARDVAAIGLGLILLRRPGPGTAALRRLEHRSEPLPENLGAHLLVCLRAHDALGDDIAGARLRVADDVTEQREHLPGDPEPTRIRLVQQTGFGRTVAVDTVTAAFVGACDGELSVEVLAAAVAEVLGLAPEETRQAVCRTARRLVLDGFLT